MVGVKMQHISYKGGAPAMTELLGNNIHLIFSTVSTAITFIKAGRIRPIAVTSGYGYLLGLFPINLVHNLVHLAIGVWGVVAYRSLPAARIYARGLAVIYGVLTVFGLIPGLNTLFGLTPLFGHDVWLHALTAVIAAWFGWKAVEPMAAGTR